MGHYQPLFLYLRLFYKQLTANKCSKKLLLIGFEPGSSKIGSDCAANVATTTARYYN